MHAALTDSTAFGTALHLYFWLDRFASSGHAYDVVLGALVESCRRVQEYFATYASVDTLKEWVDPAEILEGYPEYKEYYELAERLTALPGFRLPYHGIKAVAQVCMQSEILCAVQRRGLAEFRVSDLRVGLRPDHRLRELRPVLTEGFWRDLLAGWERASADGCWREVAALNTDPDRYGELSDGHLADALHRFDVYAFDTIRSAFEERTGLRTIAYDGHIEPVRALIEEANVLAPDASFAIYPEANAQVPRREEALQTFGDEQFVLRSARLVADAAWVDASRPSNAEPFVSSHGTVAHYFFVVRTRDEIADAYELGEDAREWLAARRERYVVALRTHRKSVSGEVTVRLGFIGGLSDIQLLDSLDGSGPLLLGNIPMSVLRLPGFDAMLDRARLRRG